MTHRRFVRSLPLAHPREAVFAWHERPGAFERLSPPWQRVEVVRSDGRITDGARIELRARVAPHPMLDPIARLVVRERWLVEHEGYVAGHVFRDVLREGPFAHWAHTHRMDDAAAPGASVLTDDVSYALPFGALGALGASFAEAELDRLFRHRHRVTAHDLARHAAAAHAAPDRGPLTVAITGASGLVGRALTAFLTTGGHTVVRIGRGDPPAGQAPHAQLRDVRWDPARGQLDPGALEGADVVVHLAGANVGERWTPQHRRDIADSRVQGTRLIAETVARMARRPRALVSMSATGYYGDRGDEVLDESSAPGTGFLADVAQRWEAAADPARAAGVRVVHPRLGVVLTGSGGALERMLTPFQLGAGGPLGDGRQWWSVIALDDVIAALHWLAVRDDLSGPVNVVSPEPLRNADFARVLGHVLGRPALVPAPAFALRLLLGREQADAMLLASQRVVPHRLVESGFTFAAPTVERALRDALGR